MTTPTHEKALTVPTSDSAQGWHSRQGVGQPVVWLVWLGAVLATLLVTRNPFYLITLCLCIAVVESSLPPRGPALGLPFSPWRLALFILPATIIFNALLSPIGSTVLFEWPGWIPILQGGVMVEALVYGAIHGLVLVAMIAAFHVLTRALPTHALLRLMPRAFYPVAVTATLALTFVPSTLQQFREIREAQAVRGHKLEGVRAWLPLFVPLLVGGMERALQLAEAMTARGFASQSQNLTARDRAILIVALFSLLVGWVARTGWSQLWGEPLSAAGGLLIVVWLWVIGRRVRHTTYRTSYWRPIDGVVLAMTLLALLTVGQMIVVGAWGSYYGLHGAPPEFNLGAALFFLLLLAPVFRNADLD